MSEGLEKLSDEKRKSKQGLCDLEKTKRDLLCAYKYLKGGYQKSEARLFVMLCNRTGATGITWNREVPSEHEKKLFTVGVREPWNRLPRDVVESPSPKIFQLAGCLLTLQPAVRNLL